MYTIVDTSVFVDVLLRYDPGRSKRAQNLLDRLKPEVFSLELISQLVRRMPVSRGRGHPQRNNVIHSARQGYPGNLLYRICRDTGSRAIDAYYIGAAVVLHAPLYTMDRIQYTSAQKHCIEAHYLLE